MTSPKSYRYRDTVAAKGSHLYRAIEAGDMKLAEQIYQECEREFRKHYTS